MFGGESLTVDMGAYEYYINDIEADRSRDVVLTWSSLAGKSYAIHVSSNLMTWEFAADDVPSAGAMTTSWTDDGSATGVPPSLAARRFYRILENP